MKTTKVVLLTDIHLPAEGKLAENIDTRTNFLSVLEAIRKEDPKHIIIGGDICFRESDVNVYKWVKANLDSLGVEYSCISGNHDNSVDLARILHPELEFNSITKELYYVKYISGKRFLFLDTAIGEMSPDQWHWLKENLTENQETFIIMHHSYLGFFIFSIC